MTRPSPPAPPGAPAPAPRDRRGVTLELLRRYDRPGPRYTSYPTAVEFTDRFGWIDYRRRLAAAAQRPAEPLSLYVHLPFCQARCAFCGCHAIATMRREVAERYLGDVERELALLGEALGERRRLVQHHWGGGTPSYLSPAQMERLHRAVTGHFSLVPEAEVAVEVDPRVTTEEHVETLARLGFNRLSLGVQDFTPEVQQAVGRVQSEPDTRALVECARSFGFSSIAIDLIYGLPRQRLETFARTLDAVIALRPERVPVYSFAHVPWIHHHQRRIRADELPAPRLKLELFVEARERFLSAGYQQIGMDHFALPRDELARAAARGSLHRNFMGYTTRLAPDMLGVGISSISDVAGAFAQNTKKLNRYRAALDAGELPVERGYGLDADDLLRRHVITQLMCNFRLVTRQVEERFAIDFAATFARELCELRAGPAEHGFVRVDDEAIEVTEVGKLFVRNVCMVFDRYLRRQSGDKPVFSRTV